MNNSGCHVLPGPFYRIFPSWRAREPPHTKNNCTGSLFTFPAMHIALTTGYEDVSSQSPSYIFWKVFRARTQPSCLAGTPFIRSIWHNKKKSIDYYLIRKRSSPLTCPSLGHVSQLRGGERCDGITSPYSLQKHFGRRSSKQNRGLNHHNPHV